MKSTRSFIKVFFTGATLVAFSASSILLTGCNTTAAIVGAIAGASALVAVVVVAKYKANERQKAAAEEQARIATVALAAKAKPASRKQRGRVKAATKKRVASQASETGAASPGPAAATSMATTTPVQPATPARPIPSPEELDKALERNLPEYLAVPVPKQQIAAEARGEATYMLWDTHRQQLATDDVYVLKHDVRDGATVKLNGVKARVAIAQ